MARFFTFVLIALLPAGFAGAQPAAGPSPDPSPCPAVNSPREGGRHDDDEGMKRFRKKLEKMPPEEREHFRENWMRWKSMGDREREDWKKRAADERDRLKQFLDDAIAKTGLSLTPDQREVFIVRYRQERRKIEEQLRAEMEAKRREKNDEMLGRLKAEFEAAPAATASPSPLPTP